MEVLFYLAYFVCLALAQGQVDDATCTKRWMEYIGQTRNNVAMESYFYPTEAECRLACEQKPTQCVAYSFRLGPGLEICAFYDDNLADNLVDNPEFSHFQFEATCVFDDLLETTCRFKSIGAYMFTGELTVSPAIRDEDSCILECATRDDCQSVVNLMSGCQLSGDPQYYVGSRTTRTGSRQYKKLGPCTVAACNSNPCQNGGACNQHDNEYQCSCVLGYIGVNCEEYDQCSSSPCQHGGTCTYTGNVYTCQCPVFYTGDDCQDHVGCSPTRCFNGGTCNEENNSFQCRCNPGYLGDTCDNYDECVSSPCQNGARCVDSIAMYSCECPVGTQGVHCQQVIQIDSLYPIFGPVSGGTLITLTGENFIRDALLDTGIWDPEIMEVYVGPDKCDTLLLTRRSIVARTPAGSYSNISLPVRLKPTDLDNSWMTGLNFMYKADPFINEIHPIATILRGGTTITVVGEYLNSVQNPVLTIDVYLQTFSVNGNERELVETDMEHYYGRNCEIINQESVVCVTPAINLTDDFQKPRQKRDAGTADDTWSTDTRVRRQVLGQQMMEHTATLYLGFLLDGVEDYKNLSENARLSQYGKITLNSQPQFNASQQEFQFEKGKNVHIEGEGLDHVEMSDYRVDVGDDECNISEVLSNAIVCLPPQARPGQKNHTQGYRVLVQTGVHIKNVVGYLSYPGQLYYIIGIACGVGVLLIIGIIAACVGCRQRENIKKQQQYADSVYPPTFENPAIIPLPPIHKDLLGEVQENPEVDTRDAPETDLDQEVDAVFTTGMLPRYHRVDVSQSEPSESQWTFPTDRTDSELSEITNSYQEDLNSNWGSLYKAQ